MQIRTHYEESTEATPREQRNFKEGLRYARRRPELLATLFVKLGQSLGNVDALVIIYAEKLFISPDGDSTTPLSIMLSAFGFGAVLGPILLNRFNNGTVRTMRRLIIVGYVWITLGWLLFGNASTLWLVSLALVLRAMGGSANWTYSSVIIQKSTPNEFLGRMFSLDMAGFQFASVISTLATGLLVDIIGAGNVRNIVILMAVISLIPLVLWVLTVPKLEKRELVTVAVVGD
jgi:MFS family permease